MPTLHHRTFTSDHLLFLVLTASLLTASYAIPRTLQHICDLTRIPADVIVEYRDLFDEEDSARTGQLRWRDGKNHPDADGNGDKEEGGVEPEDRIRLATLRTLALSPASSAEVRKAAVKIVVGRALKVQHGDGKGKVLERVIGDLGGEDGERRDRAIDVLAFLLSSGEDLGGEVGTVRGWVVERVGGREGFGALVKALRGCLDGHRQDDDGGGGKGKRGRSSLLLPSSPLMPVYRPPRETKLLRILRNMLGLSMTERIEMALDAGLVTEWLAVYPFPCSVYEGKGGRFKKEDVLRLFTEEETKWAGEDPLMAAVFQSLTASQRAVGELRDAGLATEEVDTRPIFQGIVGIWRGYSDETADGDGDGDTWMHGGETTAGIPVPTSNWESWTPRLPRGALGTVADRRRAGRSAEEENLRRRHREAVVVAEEGWPLSRENIVQRDLDSGDERD